MTVALTAESVSKRFNIGQNRPSTLKESLIRVFSGRCRTGGVLWALRDVCFSVEKGRTLGIIGHNGAGKSTLLRLLCGLGRPSAGRIHRTGYVSGLLELGSGFHPEMTGMENVMTAGILNGLTRRQVLDRTDEIISFAELEGSIDLPLRTYSTGMYLRLSFSTAIHFDPDTLLIDEVLAVGDSRFQQKCMDRLNGFRKRGKTLILVSHSTEQIRSLCDEVVVLEEGRVVIQADPENAVQCYNDLMRRRTERRAGQVSKKVARPCPAMDRGSRLGTGEATIETIEMVDEQGRDTDTLQSGRGLAILLGYRLAQPLADLVVLLGIYSETGVKCFETVVPSAAEAFGPLGEEGSLRCELPALPLLPGRYYIVVGLYPPDWSYTYDYHWQMHVLHVESSLVTLSSLSGVVSVHPAWYLMTKVERRTRGKMCVQH